MVGQRVGDRRGGSAGRAVSPRPARGLGQHRRDLVVAAQPGDLLDEVGAVAQVGAPATAARDDVSVAGRRRPSTAQPIVAQMARTTHLVARVVHADAAGRAGRRVESDGRRGRALVDVGDARVGRAAAELDQQARRPARRPLPATSGSTPRSKRLDASVASLCRRDGAGDRDRVEVRGLDEHVRSSAPSTSVRGAAHDAGERRAGAAAVGDQQVLGVERALDVVEGRRAAPLPRARRTTIAPASVSRSKACSGWPSSSIT